jgi:hypothetical protein
VVITSGDNDTYPMYQLQSKGIRTDVLVVNAYLIQIDEYRERIFKELSIPALPETMDTKQGATNPNGSKILAHLAQHLKRPLYFVVTMDENYLLELKKENLHLTGLTYLYSLDMKDELALIKKNFSGVYKLDYLETNFQKDISQYSVDCLNQNYIVPLLTLYKHYRDSGEKDKQAWAKNLIMLLSEKSEEKEAILKEIKE